MKRSIHRILHTASISCIVLFFVSCQSPNIAQIEVNISRAKKDPNPYKIASKSSPDLLSFEELTTLLKEHGKETKASEKMTKLFSTPFVDNSNFKKHGLPKPHKYEMLGEALRISTWNIEKSINVSKVADVLSSQDAFNSELKKRYQSNKKLQHKALLQHAALASSDILLCQEMDIGHCRSGYLFAAKHLAQKLNMNFVYAPQQLEIDPVYLGADDVEFQNKSLAGHSCNASAASPKDYKGVFGVAVLSRYPIKRVQVFPLKTQPYDWYVGEIQKPDILENLRRFASEQLFHFKPTREVKVGGRGFTRVDLHIPDVPHETLSVINIHLEIKATPKQRLEQLNEILSYIKEIKNPVVMAGDFNNSSRDVSSTSIARASTRSASDPQNVFATTLYLANATMISQIRTIVNQFKNFKNPLAWDLPAVLPNKRKQLFKAIENFRFSDGGAFDFRGDSERSTRGYGGTLSNSNQRTFYKGFTFTFAAPRPIGTIGRDRLDWIFVKSFLTHPKDKNGSYQLAPHFGETLRLMNRAAKEPYSDHHPISILLPLNEPEL